MATLSSANVPDQPRGPSEDGVSDADESPEDGRLPALCCGAWLALLVLKTFSAIIANGSVSRNQVEYEIVTSSIVPSACLAENSNAADKKYGSAAAHKSAIFFTPYR